MFFLAVTACLVTTGCSDEYDDSVLTERIEALENRMKELEELCKRLNENDYITIGQGIKRILDEYAEEWRKNRS